MKQKYIHSYIKHQIEVVLHFGSILHTKEYKDSRQKLDITCEKRHKFKMNWDNIKQDQWCPICSQGKFERGCHRIFESIFGYYKSRNKNINVWMG